MSELSQRASDRRDAEHIRDDGYRTDEERRLAGRYIALDDVLIAAEAKIERRNATYTKPGEGFVCFHCGERFLTYESAKEHFGEKPDAQPTCFATPSPTIAAPSPSNEPAVEWVMCAVRDAMREHNFVVERGSDLWNRLRRHVEAALKARKPADDGNEG